MAHKVTFFPGSTTVEVDDGETILEAAIKAKVQVNNVCGGKGTCGKCMVIVDGNVDGERGKLSEEEFQLGYRLACQARVRGDLSVFISEKQQVTEHQILVTYNGRDVEELSPITETRKLDLTAPTKADNMADLERVTCALDIPDLMVPLDLLRSLPGLLREGGWQLSVLFAREDGGHRLMALEKGSKVIPNYGVAVDIGTTTVVAELVDLSTGKTVGHASDYNRQLVCGEDVLSRIAYAEERGLERLTDLVTDTVNGLIAQLCAERDKRRRFHSGTCADDIASVAIGGNTTMVHMLLGLDPKNIRYDPYIPVTNVPPSLLASEVKLRAHPDAPVYCVPGKGIMGGRGHHCRCSAVRDAPQGRAVHAHRCRDQR
jgi:uncharacterized 2Fe-2S/4Fe-4S cluster protein (DUF4445 family)